MTLLRSSLLLFYVCKPQSLIESVNLIELAHLWFTTKDTIDEDIQTMTENRVPSMKLTLETGMGFGCPSLEVIIQSISRLWLLCSPHNISKGIFWTNPSNVGTSEEPPKLTDLSTISLRMVTILLNAAIESEPRFNWGWYGPAIRLWSIKRAEGGAPTWVSVTLSSLAMSARSLELRYFFSSNCFSSSKICRPVNVVRAFFFRCASPRDNDPSSPESSTLTPSSSGAPPTAPTDELLWLLLLWLLFCSSIDFLRFPSDTAHDVPVPDLLLLFVIDSAMKRQRPQY